MAELDPPLNRPPPWVVGDSVGAGPVHQHASQLGIAEETPRRLVRHSATRSCYCGAVSPLLAGVRRRATSTDAPLSFFFTVSAATRSSCMDARPMAP